MTETFTKTALESASNIIRTSSILKVFGGGVLNCASEEDHRALDELKSRIANKVESLIPNP